MSSKTQRRLRLVRSCAATWYRTSSGSSRIAVLYSVFPSSASAVMLPMLTVEERQVDECVSKMWTVPPAACAKRAESAEKHDGESLISERDSVSPECGSIVSGSTVLPVCASMRTISSSFARWLLS